MRLYLCNGHRVELNGDANAPYEIEMKGNKLNRNLWKFICKHKEIFTDSYSAGVQSEFRPHFEEVYEQKIARLDSLLIDYIENHPSDVMSSILIGDYLLRYDNYALCNTLWQGLSVKAQLPYIAQTMEHLSRDLAITNENGKLPYMRMLGNNDSICYISTRKSKATLVCIWNTIDEQSEVMHKVLQHYARRYTDRQLQIATISFDGDTARWHSVVDSDTSRVVDMWSDGLYTSDVFAKYNITRLPVYMLGDSLGNVLVRTSQLPDQDIDAQLDSLVSIDKYKIETPILKP